MATPFSDRLLASFKQNYGSQKADIQLSLASMKATGVKIQPLMFQDFLRSDGRVLIFSAATRNSELMSVVKLSQSHEILWYVLVLFRMKQVVIISQRQMGKDTFTFSGRLFIVCAPTLSHRFGSIPRNITIPDIASMSQDDFWESERIRIWKQLSPSFRASFTWPASGELRTLGSSMEGSVYKDSTIKVPPPASTSLSPSFKYTKLDFMDDSANKSPPSVLSFSSPKKPLTKDEELRFTHTMAFDNFAILVFKASRVDHVSSSWPPVRTIYSANKDGAWVVEDVNP
ncbi:hypothetical protein HDU97_007277 [Phlyctochytrium planicorne]|nr:hypothetical protein HDU97_007277 [Phlyctochytrium planicorne]